MAGRSGSSQKKKRAFGNKNIQSNPRAFAVSNNVAVICVLAILAIIALFLNYNRVVVCTVPTEGTTLQSNQAADSSLDIAGQAVAVDTVEDTTTDSNCPVQPGINRWCERTAPAHFADCRCNPGKYAYRP